ncbi:MAG: hypothetical protein IJ207_06450 [Treponema sp.]|uniref:hypothetical protein n=1 Tax=Treponema sp. TaxID=166 RepID=UPI0025D9B77A|nr:hypothetical protein [Treponema sp.]MBQ9281824.1 hypothetical protein [Treponema sp.]
MSSTFYSFFPIQVHISQHRQRLLASKSQYTVQTFVHIILPVGQENLSVSTGKPAVKLISIVAISAVIVIAVMGNIGKIGVISVKIEIIGLVKVSMSGTVV